MCLYEQALVLQEARGSFSGVIPGCRLRLKAGKDDSRSNVVCMRRDVSHAAGNVNCWEKQTSTWGRKKTQLETLL